MTPDEIKQLVIDTIKSNLEIELSYRNSECSGQRLKVKLSIACEEIMSHEIDLY